ncbi:MAG: adenylate cyclase [Rhizobacter sp.]|nr:adenylate cyclase [Rhizobacter sp.]
MVEVELKFCFPSERLAAIEAAVSQGATPRMRMQAHYFDTADGRLASAHMALRLRKEGRRWVQTLKAGGDSHIARIEHNVDVVAAPQGAVPVLDVSRHDGTPAGDRLRAALQGRHAHEAQPPLLTIYSTDIWRRIRLVRVKGAVVELALDQGRINASDRHDTVRELEFELKSGDAGALIALAHRWAQRHGMWLSTTTKAERGERLARGETLMTVAKAQPPRVDRKMPADTLLRAVVHACLMQMLPNASAVASGRFGDDHVHQLRVGIRRLRTALREMSEPVQGVDPQWEQALADTFGQLGEYRDTQSVLGALEPELTLAGAPEGSLLSSDPGEASPEAAVRAAAFQKMLLVMLAFTLEGEGDNAAPDEDADAGQPALHAVCARLDKLHRQVTRDARKFETLAPELQHRVRKRLKRLRYLSEFMSPLFGRGAVKRYLAGLRPAQEALGAHNDAVVALHRYREAAERDPQAWFAVGWLTAKLASTAKDSRKALEAVTEARRFWKKAARKTPRNAPRKTPRESAS